MCISVYCMRLTHLQNCMQSCSRIWIRRREHLLTLGQPDPNLDPHVLGTLTKIGINASVYKPPADVIWERYFKKFSKNGTSSPRRRTRLAWPGHRRTSSRSRPRSRPRSRSRSHCRLDWRPRSHCRLDWRPRCTHEGPQRPRCTHDTRGDEVPC